MRFRSAFISTASRARNIGGGRSAPPPPPPPSSLEPFLRRSYSLLRSHPERSSFAIAFDIDGVILRGRTPIGGSPRALSRLYDAHGNLMIPFLFLTNGGGVPESKRASELSKLLGVQISALQVVQGHSPFRDLVKRFENDLIVAVGKGEPALVMSEYGFKKVLSIDEYASYFSDIDPLTPYKTWTVKQTYDGNHSSTELKQRYDVQSDSVKAAFVVSDPVDWGRDIQVLCDILKGGGIPGNVNGHQPPLYFAADDLEYQNAENILTKLLSSIYQVEGTTVEGSSAFSTIYMIGDNPEVDVLGAKKAGQPWFSVLTRTGVFRGKDNGMHFPADMVVDTVEDAVDFILKKEEGKGS